MEYTANGAFRGNKLRRMTTPEASSKEVRKRRQATRQTGTEAELRLRRELDKLDLEYAVNQTVVSGSRSRADIIFSTAKVAVFVDCCFWHGCPWHGTSPKINARWWKVKLQGNRDRDGRTNSLLGKAGWRVLRFWEHTVLPSPENAVRNIAHHVAQQMKRPKWPHAIGRPTTALV